VTDTAVERAELTSQQRAARVRAESNGGVHPGGRSTDYHPRYCGVIVELGREGYSQARMAASIGVAKSTITEWAKVHKEFSNALSLARTLSQAWWEEQAQGGLKNREFNAGIWDKSVKSMFREDYQDRSTVEHVGKDDGPIEIRDDMAAARRIAFMLGRAVGKQQSRKADEPQP
jgi:hypothetical protein